MKPKTEEDGWRGFIEEVLKSDSKKKLEEFLILMFTPSEKEEMAARFRIFQELLKGEKTQRDIARDLGVSIFNVTRGSNALKTAKSELKKRLEKTL